MKKTYSTKEWMRMVKYIDRFKVIPKRNKLKLVIGFSLITLGVVTLPLPTGSPLIILFGCSILGIKKQHLIEKYEDIKFRIKSR